MKIRWINVQFTALFTMLGLVSGQQCPGEIGRDDTVAGNARRANQFYLNRGSPATCDGMITSFSYCHYGPTDTSPSVMEYLVTFAVYRPQGGLRYTAVSPTIVLRKTPAEISGLGESSFTCSSLTLDQPVTVQTGDVLGACVVDFPGGEVFRLDIAGRPGPGNPGGNILRAETAPATCTATSVPSNIDFDNVGGDVQNQRVLFLFAVIDTIPATTSLPTTTQMESTTETSSTESPITTQRTTAARPTSTGPPLTTPAARPTSTGVAPVRTTAVRPTSAGPPVTTQGTTATRPTPTGPPVTTQGTTAARPTPTGPPVTTQGTTAARPTPTGPPVTTAQTTESTGTVATSEPTNSAGLGTTGDSTNEQTSTNGDDSTTASKEFVGGSDGATIAAVVVVVLIIVVVSTVVLTVVIALLLRQKKNEKSYPVTGNSSINNQLYDVAGENAPKFQEASESQEHVYEFDASRSNEYTYAEVGPFGETGNGEIVYESPLDAPAISYAQLLERNKEEDIYVGENPYEVPASREGEIYTQLKSWGVRQIKTHEFEIAGHLGSGQFGNVEQGVWKREGIRPVDVALKSLNKTLEENKVKFLQEAAIMAQFRHPNVIMLHGVVIRGDPMMLVVELAKKGDLRAFLLSIRPDPGELVPSSTPKMFLKFSQQVALGMQYLSAKGFVHRDLAARNVLLTSNNVCKVADFGMSRDLADENYYVSQGKDKIPVKWTAPEALHYKKYSTASDVWAYGCLLYEIWSVGHKPFEGVSNFEAIRLIDSGKRLSPPPGCSKMIYELMTLCWHPETSQRVSFRDIVLTLVGREETVLNIPKKDSSSNPLAGVLGAPLEAGENMYSELQRKYRDFYYGATARTDGDYFHIN